MKTVKIPTFMNPFVVTVNGVTYTYRAGDTVEVEDHIAEIIERSAYKTPPAPPRGISWNDLSDRPFGEEDTGSDTLTWDCNTEGLHFNEVVGAYKISDATPTLEEAINGSITLQFINGEVATFPVAEHASGDVSGMWSAEFIFVVPESAVGVDLGDGLTFSESGIYSTPEILLSLTFTIPGYTGFPKIKKINKKYLPGPIILYVDSDKYLYETSDTSNPANRITRARLKAIWETSCGKYLLGGISDDLEIYMAPTEYAFTNTVGKLTVPTFGTFHTAEYTG